MKYGFEREYFLTNSAGELVMCPAELPADGYPVLAEARGKAMDTPTEAAYMLLCEEDRLGKIAANLGLTLHIDIASAKLNKHLRRAVAMKTSKDASRLLKRGNIYGKPIHGLLMNGIATAGLHVHLNNPYTITSRGESGRESIQTVQAPFDWVRIIQHLDKTFAAVIKEHHRTPGEYEFGKFHGGIEYRSLPTVVNPVNVAFALQEL